MLIISACMGAAVIEVLYYAALCMLGSRLEPKLEKKGKFLTAKSVWATGALTAAVCIYIGLQPHVYMNIPFFVQTMTIVWGMSVLAVTDYCRRIIPNQFIIVLLALWALIAGSGLIADMDAGLAVLFASITGGIAAGVIFFLCYIISRGQLGAGDVKLAFVLGLYMTGQRIMGALVYGVLLCCIYSIVQLARKKIGMKDGVPLVPFLYIGMLITLIIL